MCGNKLMLIGMLVSITMAKIILCMPEYRPISVEDAKKPRIVMLPTEYRLPNMLLINMGRPFFMVGS